MFKNQAGQGIYVHARNSSTRAAATGDAANITAIISKDGAASAATNDVNPTEIAGGAYWFDLTQAETNCDIGIVVPTSATENVVLTPVEFATGQDANVTEWLGTAPATPTTAGVPEVDVVLKDGAAFSEAFAFRSSVARSGSNDLWGLTWYRDGNVITDTITAATITVLDIAAGTNLFSASATVLGTTGTVHLSNANQIVRTKLYRIGGTVTIGGTTATSYSVASGADLLADYDAISERVWRRTSAEITADATAAGQGSAASEISIVSTLDGKADDISADTTAILEDTSTTLPATLSTIDGKVDTVDGVADAILVDTGTTLPATLATIDGKADTIVTDTGTTIPATIATVDANVDAILVDTGTTLPATLATIDGNVDSILTDTGTTLPATLAALNDVTAADVATAVLTLSNGVETGYTLQQAMRIVLSAAAAKVSGMDDNAPVFRDVGDTKARITATTDANGNRTAVTLDAT